MLTFSMFFGVISRKPLMFFFQDFPDKIYNFKTEKSITVTHNKKNNII